MNELDELRGWEAGAPPLDDDTRHRARVRLFAAMNERPTAVRPSRRRPVLRIAVTGLVAAAVAATFLVAHDGAGDGHRPRPPAEVTEVAVAKVLNGAAARERKHGQRTVVPRDDQFLYSKRVIEETEQKTGEVRTYTDEMWDSVDGSKRSLSMELGRVMWEEPMGKGEGVWPPRRWDELKKLPTVPERLVPAIVSMGNSDTPISALTKDDRWQAYFLLGELLKAPTLPGGLRAAAYEGLALVPGVKTVEGVEDSAGRPGVGIAYPSRFEGRYLIFDPKSYAFLGFRDERVSRDGKKTYTQLSHTVEWAVVDKVRQRP
ncbi:MULTISPECIES: CU044_5270 family protein [unclassified Streptomyces]|uniref:CU044_5270 family protein n=1 Tax=unclassified Streptomyces TaxID=2593676 RepID=UPI0033C037A5